MRCSKCRTEITDKNLKTCQKCGTKINKNLPIWLTILLVFFGIGFFVFPFIIIILTMTLPVLIANTNDIQYKTLFFKNFAQINQAMVMAQTLTDKNYDKTDLVWKNSVKEYLNIEKEIQNGIRLMDETEIKYKKLRENCSKVGSTITLDTACAILTIDVNGFENEPNKRSVSESSEIKINDQFETLLYSDEIVLIPNSVEEKIIKIKED